MTETAKLLRLFRVDQQLRGLRTRLDASERVLGEQQRVLKDLGARHQSAGAELKRLKTSVASDDSETATIDARIEKIRDQMNLAKTNKEYSAFLSELNALKEQKDVLEKHELEEMGKIEALDKQVADLAAQLKERETIVAKAQGERDTKEAEIRDRLTELQAQRDALRAEVSPSTAKTFDDLVRSRGDEAMSHVEVLDRRNHEWTCGSCRMALPVETINNISNGRLTRCVSCQCFLYTEEEDIVSKKEPKESRDVKASKAKVAKAKSAKTAKATAAKDEAGAPGVDEAETKAGV